MRALYKTENVSTFYNRRNKTICIELTGCISYEEFKASMEALFDQSLELGLYNIILDFEKMTDLSENATSWFQSDFIINHGSKLLSQCNKMAIIQPIGMTSQYISGNILQWFLRIDTQLKHQLFGSMDDAKNWMKPSSHNSKNQMVFSFIPVIAQFIGLRLTQF